MAECYAVARNGGRVRGARWRCECWRVCVVFVLSSVLVARCSGCGGECGAVRGARCAVHVARCALRVLLIRAARMCCLCVWRECVALVVLSRVCALCIRSAARALWCVLRVVNVQRSNMMLLAQ
jgi:hypothetical protein